jgi:hypothetical protein
VIWKAVSVAVVVMLWSGTIFAASRNALVIGIANYHALPRLTNTVNDAESVAAALRRSDFDVELLIDPDTASLQEAVAGLDRKTQGSSAALFYYAGHAVQYENRNYLLGVDAHPANVDDLETQGLDLAEVMSRLVKTKLRLIFVDACRDSPFSFSEHVGGLAPLSVGLGTTLVFSAAPEEVALDGNGLHSPFATALLAHMSTMGLELSPMLRAVSADLQIATDGKQQMSPFDNRTSEFFFVPTRGLKTEERSRADSVAIHDVSGLLSKLQQFSGAERLFQLQDSIHSLPARAELDAGQVQALLGDIPAPALRRYGLKLLLPFTLRPISAPDGSRLLASFTGGGRGEALNLILPCLSRPMPPNESSDIVGDTPAPLRAVLTSELGTKPERALCPKF